MRARLADLLVCPTDRGTLELRAWEEMERPVTGSAVERASECGVPVDSLRREIVSGVLLNPRLRIAYPIHAGVPRMLRFRTGVGERFAAIWGSRLSRELPGFHLPSDAAMPGEEEVLRTFSSEWTGYDWDGKSYWNQSAEAWFRSMDYALRLEPGSLRGKRVLEVGIGIGGVAHHVCTTQRCEQIGMDLGYAVDAAYRHFGSEPLLHIVQASAFHPPIAERSVDLAYSFGVIHHTFSTKRAFDTVARLPRVGGRLYIWVYSPENEKRTPLRRALMAIENVARPVITRLPEKAQTLALAPAIPAYLAVQWARALRDPSQTTYGVREALHAARDRLTPPFAHRHSEADVRRWFTEAGYGRLLGGSERTPPDWLPVGFYANTAVEGVMLEGAPASVTPAGATGG